MTTIYSGDTRPFTGRLKLGNSFIVIQNSDTIKAKFVDKKTDVDITALVDCPSTNQGSDWINGRISIVLPQIESDKLAAYAKKTVRLAIQHESLTLGKKEYHADISILKGLIA